MRPSRPKKRLAPEESAEHEAFMPAMAQDEHDARHDASTNAIEVVRSGNFLRNVASPGWMSNLALSPDEARDSATQVFGNLNIIAALMLSSILGNALDPLTHSSKPKLAAAFNIVTAIMVICCVTTTLFTVYFNCAFFSLRGQDVYNAILKCHKSALWYFTTLLSGMLTVVLMILSAWLKLDTAEATQITVLSIGMFLVLFYVFGESYCDMFPLDGQFWTYFCAPQRSWFNFGSAQWLDAKSRAEHVALLMSANFEEHYSLPAEQPEQHLSVPAEKQSSARTLKAEQSPSTSSAAPLVESANVAQHTSDTKAAATLTPRPPPYPPPKHEPLNDPFFETRRSMQADALLALLRRALPHEAAPRLQVILENFVADDLTVEALKKAASCGGTQLLWQVLSSPRLGLTSGMRVELIYRLTAGDHSRGHETPGPTSHH